MPILAEHTLRPVTRPQSCRALDWPMPRKNWKRNRYQYAGII